MGSKLSLNKGENNNKKFDVEKVQTNINNLNTDCLAEIFSYLPIRERLYMNKGQYNFHSKLKKNLSIIMTFLNSTSNFFFSLQKMERCKPTVMV